MEQFGLSLQQERAAELAEEIQYKIKQEMLDQMTKRSCQHQAIARHNDTCRTTPRATGSGHAPRTRTPRTPPTPPPTTISPPMPLPPLSLPSAPAALSHLPPLSPHSAPAALSALPPLSPLSPLYAFEPMEILGPDFDLGLEIERTRY